MVVLYARLHGDIPLVINVAGRFDLKEGIEQRFGADIFNRVLHEPVFLPAERDDGHTWTWHLTAEVGDDGDYDGCCLCVGSLCCDMQCVPACLPALSA